MDVKCGQTGSEMGPRGRLMLVPPLDGLWRAAHLGPIFPGAGLLTLLALVPSAEPAQP